MNSSQRRKDQRNWCRRNKDEIDRVVKFVKSPIIFVFSRVSFDGCLEMDPNRKAFFESTFPRSQSFWKNFLEKKGVRI